MFLQIWSAWVVTFWWGLPSPFIHRGCLLTVLTWRKEQRELSRVLHRDTVNGGSTLMISSPPRSPDRLLTLDFKINLWDIQSAEYSAKCYHVHNMQCYLKSADSGQQNHLFFWQEQRHSTSWISHRSRVQCVQGDVWLQKEPGLRQKRSQVTEWSKAETRTMWFSLEGCGEEGRATKDRQTKSVMGGEWHRVTRGESSRCEGVNSNTSFSVLTSESIHSHWCGIPGFESAMLKQFPLPLPRVRPCQPRTCRTLFLSCCGCDFGFVFSFVSQRTTKPSS